MSDDTNAHRAGRPTGETSLPGPSHRADETTSETAAIEADIERTRADLAATVDQLTAKLDVRTRMRHRISDLKVDTADRLEQLRGRVTDERGRPTPGALAVGAGAAAAIVAIVVIAAWRGDRAARRSGRRWDP